MSAALLAVFKVRSVVVSFVTMVTLYGWLSFLLALACFMSTVYPQHSSVVLFMVWQGCIADGAWFDTGSLELIDSASIEFMTSSVCLSIIKYASRGEQ